MIDNIYSKNKTILIVAHGGINTALNIVIRNRSVTEFENLQWNKNTAFSEFKIEEDENCKILFLNCVKHLE